MAATKPAEKVKLWLPKPGVPTVWAPQPGAQTALLSCPFDEILYGGAKGGGKSDGALGAWLGHMAMNANHAKWARGIIFRKAYPDLEQLMQRAWEIFSPLGARWNANKKTWYFKSGATLKFRFVTNKKDAGKYQGHEYTFMCFDEVGEIAEVEIINTLRGALRNSKGVLPLLLLTGNPLGPGHKWLFNRFIKGKRAYEPTTETEINSRGERTTWTRVFIPSTLDDNPLLMLSQPGYEMQIKAMCIGRPGLYRALRYGDWTAKLEQPGALLTMETIDEYRLSKYDKPEVDFICIGVDPQGSGDPEADECGIVVSGSNGRHKYTLEDASTKGGPRVWGPKVVKLYWKWEPNWVVAESNFGGEMVTETITKYEDAIKVELVNVSKGKHVRAEPTAAEHERGYIHHVGEFEKLEEEWTTWVTNRGMRSPNRLDADVFSKHKLSNGSDGLSIRDL